MREASHHYECLGVDPSPYAIKVARENGLNVVQEDFETGDFGTECFDAIVLYAVIEHLRDPLTALRKAHGLLAKRGIVAIQTPNLDGPARWWHGRDWNGFRVGYHLYMFNGDTLARLMRTAGFDVLKKPRRSHFLDDSIILWGRRNDAKTAHPTEAYFSELLTSNEDAQTGSHASVVQGLSPWSFPAVGVGRTHIRGRRRRRGSSRGAP